MRTIKIENGGFGMFLYCQWSVWQKIFSLEAEKYLQTFIATLQHAVVNF
jgi:hypothetical protein